MSRRAVSEANVGGIERKEEKRTKQTTKEELRMANGREERKRRKESLMANTLLLSCFFVPF